MKDAILIELAKRWEDESKVEVTCCLIDGDDNREIFKGIGYRECKRECADTIKTLISMLGDKNP